MHWCYLVLVRSMDWTVGSAIPPFTLLRAVLHFFTIRVLIDRSRPDSLDYILIYLIAPFHCSILSPKGHKERPCGESDWLMRFDELGAHKYRVLCDHIRIRQSRGVCSGLHSPLVLLVPGDRDMRERLAASTKRFTTPLSNRYILASDLTRGLFRALIARIASIAQWVYWIAGRTVDTGRPTSASHINTHIAS
jgi:hypothetical protein